MCNKPIGMPQDVGNTKKVLFIGNSATYVNDIPQTLSRLAEKAGYKVEAAAITKGGATLKGHADASTEWGRSVLAAVGEGGYDIVFLQDNSNCISTEELGAVCKTACKTLDKAIRASGAKTYIYLRPPTGRDNFGLNSYGQCVEIDKLFGGIAAELGAGSVYVNRAFAYAIKNLNIPLWGPDNAHTSKEGAYMAVCVFFSTLFNISSAVLEYNGLPEEVALSLQQAADKVVLEGYSLREPNPTASRR